MVFIDMPANNTIAITPMLTREAITRASVPHEKSVPSEEILFMVFVIVRSLFMPRFQKTLAEKKIHIQTNPNSKSYRF
jgi:hypothetical protein